MRIFCFYEFARFVPHFLEINMTKALSAQDKLDVFKLSYFF
jgi:hypothetical protein